MAEQLRSVDGRYTPDIDASKYFIVFCARKSDNALAKPGHAFVVWGKEDANAGRHGSKDEESGGEGNCEVSKDFLNE